MKRFTFLLIALGLLACLTVPAFALGGDPKIVDDADLLSFSEEATLEAMAESIVDEYRMDVVIVTVDSLGYKSSTQFADDYFDYNGYGVGSDHSDVLLLLSMEERDWAISTCGDTVDALTDYAQDRLMEDVLEYLADDEYYDGFYQFLADLPNYFEAYEDGEPIDEYIEDYADEPIDLFDVIFRIGFALVIGIVVGSVTITILKHGMKTNIAQRSAGNYLMDGSYHLNVQKDIYLYSQTSRVRKSENNSSGSSGGSSTHRSSSGRSHGGSSGKF